MELRAGTEAALQSVAAALATLVRAGSAHGGHE
jgi:hypothetical protein